MDQAQYAMLMQWRKIQSDIEQLQTEELELRNKLITSGLFYALDKKREGTETIQLGAGWTLKAEKIQYYNLTNSNKQTELALGYVAYTDPVTAAALVSWKPNLARGVFKKLDKTTQEYFKDALTISPGQSSLTLNPPTEAYLKEQAQ